VLFAGLLKRGLECWVAGTAAAHLGAQSIAEIFARASVSIADRLGP
jgi:hypothetical protein